jgi:hypothetical protein
MATTCKAITGKGTPCGCKTKPGSDFCGRHKDWSECPICYSCPGKSKMTTLECGHTFCTECIQNWFCASSDIIDSCPLCRKESLVVLSDIHVKKKMQKCFREMELLPQKAESRVYYVDKMCMYLNTKYGSKFLKGCETFRTIYEEKLITLERELNQPENQTEYYIENSKNIWKAIKRGY